MDLYRDEDEELAGVPEPDSSIAGPQTSREAVMKRISEVRNPSAADRDREAAAMEFAQNSASTAGMGRALNALAAGTGAKVDNSGYDAMEKRGADAVTQEQNRAAKVRQAIETRKLRESMMRDRARERHELELNKGVERLSKQIAPAQDTVRGVQDVEKQLGYQMEDYRGEDKDDLPGVSIPGIGRTYLFSGDEGRNFQSSVAKIFNTVLRDRSGAAVTNPEMDRLREEFNTGKFNTEGQLMAALQRYKAASAAAMKDQERGFNPEVLAEYKNRGGTTSEAMAYKPGGRADLDSESGGAIREANAGGGHGFSDEDVAMLEKAKARIKINPHDQKALKVLGVLKTKGLQ